MYIMIAKEVNISTVIWHKGEEKRERREERERRERQKRKERVEGEEEGGRKKEVYEGRRTAHSPMMSLLPNRLFFSLSKFSFCT